MVTCVGVSCFSWPTRLLLCTPLYSSDLSLSATSAYLLDYYKTGCHWKPEIDTLDELDFRGALLSLRYGLSKDNVVCIQYGFEIKMYSA